jgi:predicted RNase H-like HicB family nuclease
LIKFIKQKTLNMKLTIVITKGEEFFIGAIKEIPAAVSQGESVEEARANVIEALKFYLEDMQQENAFDNTVLEEDLIFG